jgi:RsiW-degrading membrane proteinase PrsW (M82 family)
LGIALSTGAILGLIQTFHVYDWQYEWDAALLWLGIAIVCFFSAIMLFIKDTLYKKYLSVRVWAFVSGIILSLVGLIIILFAVFLLRDSAGQPLSGFLGKILIFIALLPFAAAFIIFWRVRQAGWLKNVLIETRLP